MNTLRHQLKLARGTTLKRESVAYTAYGVLDVYRLLLDGSTYIVHVERFNPNGTFGEGCVYEGPDLAAASVAYNRLLDR
jgi:hypothetical protein